MVKVVILNNSGSGNICSSSGSSSGVIGSGRCNGSGN